MTLEKLLVENAELRSIIAEARFELFAASCQCPQIKDFLVGTEWAIHTPEHINGGAQTKAEIGKTEWQRGGDSMLRTCLAGIQLVKTGRWTVDQLERWAKATLENDAEYLREGKIADAVFAQGLDAPGPQKPQSHPRPC